MNKAVTIGFAAFLLPGCTPAREAAIIGGRKSVKETSQLHRTQDYSFAWWPNGFRKEKTDTSAEVFCVESGRYAFTLDLADFSKSRLGRIDGRGYLSASRAGSKPLADLSPALFRSEIEHQGKVYRAVDCLAGRERNPRHAIMMESGRFVQRYRFPQLQFKDETGRVLETDSTLELVAWPSSMTFSLKAAPDSAYENGPCPGVSGAGRSMRAKPMDVLHRPELDPQVFTLEAWIRVPEKLAALNGFHWLIGKNSNEWQEGNFGFMLNRRSVTAIMNIGGGRENVLRVDCRHPLKGEKWHHLAMSYDNDALRFYVDGRSAGERKLGKARKPGKGHLRIGGRPDGHGKPVHALFDEIRIWNSALPASEILSHSKNPGKFKNDGLSWRLSFDEEAKSGETSDAPNLDGATMRISLNDWSTKKEVQGEWKFGETKAIVLHCPIGDEAWRKAPLDFAARGIKGAEYKISYEDPVGANVVDVPRFERDWKTGYTDIRNYDEVELRINNQSVQQHHVPVLFDIKSPANITGMTPILCDAEGRPTGIPIQLSKNWHHGAYAKLYAILPTAPGQNSYRLRIAYGFWGKLPAASHAQLSLHGYGGNGRWDQLAIGCWGETMCLDMDNSLTPMMVTDVRMLMTRNGKDGRKWSWSDGGWGGDWLEVSRGTDSKLHPVDLKTAYLAQGPCLTDVRYYGSHGKERDVSFEARVATLRTDDHNRVFQQFHYQFKRKLDAAGSHLFKMGPNNQLVTPRIAYGNRDGLIAEHNVPANLEPGALFREQVPLTGKGPWWIAFPGSFFNNDKDWGTGSRALIIRSFRASLGGRVFTNPVVSFPVQWVKEAKESIGLNLELVAPNSVTQFMPGDTIEMDLEWITVPRVADDYYGPNETFRSHLQQHPKSWQTVYREAIGNDLEVSVTGGKLQHRYPIIISAEKPEIEVTIKGGVGVVPIRFEGLKATNTETPPRRAALRYNLYRLHDGQRIPLDQSVHTNDFWQTDYDPESDTYKMSFNLALDDMGESTWILKQR
ncbi:MAG: LamG domain-containing protein [Planctomycetota bacterium]|nr:LamG domain-containing protein [Planctomycetota bacterium]